MRKPYPFKTLALAVLICCFSPLSAQLLDWEYENIIDDVQQSGANPDMQIDAAGNIHISSWRQETNQLAYSYRNKTTGIWTYQVLDADNQSGYKSAIAIDDHGKVHIAYFLKQGNESFVKYAHNIQGSWTYEEVLPLESLGKYGPDLDAPHYVQASIDISIQDNGEPLISVFDGTVEGERRCENQVIYANYDLKLRAIVRMPTNTWQELSLPPIPFLGEPRCLNTGDRYGEFCTNIQGKDGRSYIFTNSVHNHKLLVFYSEPNDILTWSYTEIDSLQRLGPTGINQFRETFDFVDVSHPNDSIFHLVYGISDLYGFNNRSPVNRRWFYYTRFHTDSLNSPTYRPFIKNQVVPSDGVQRSAYAITSEDDQQIFMAYYDVNNASVLARTSENAGQTWRTDTLLKVINNTPLKINTYGDSVFVLTYDASKDALILSSKSVNGGIWKHQIASIQESRGEAFSSQIIRKSETRDDIFIAFSEKWRDQLFYGERINGTWSYESLDASSENIAEVKLVLDAQKRPCVAYTFRESEELRFACKQNGIWSLQVVDANSKPRNISMVVANNIIHISYFDLGAGALKYATSTLGTGNWEVVTIDETSLIVGTHSSIHADQTGTIHISYADVYTQRLKYARKPLNGIWAIAFLSEDFEYQPERMQILTDSTNQPIIAFRDAFKNRIMMARYLNNEWQLTVVREDEINFMGNPLRFILDEKDRGWIVYNFAGVFDELRLLRQDLSGSWEDVSVINNQGMVANSFDFHLVDKDFYILGKKNAREDKGLALLYAREGVTTDIFSKPENSLLVWDVYPNPSAGTVQMFFELAEAESVNLSLYNLQGKELHQFLSKQIYPKGQHSYAINLDVPSGVYFLQLQTNDQVSVKKIIVY